MIVLDTSALLYWTLDPAQLTPKAGQAIQKSDRIAISSISVWEIALKVKRHKLVIPVTITGYIERLEQLEMLDILSVDVRTWLDSVDLIWEHRDPADRIIVALANRFNCPLITSDGVIANYYKDVIW